MSCAQWRGTWTSGDILDLDVVDRQGLEDHLRSCSRCRRQALAADPTLVFLLAPSAAVSEEEIEEVRRTVHAMRRVRTLETGPRRRAHRARRLIAMAALLAVAVFLAPERPREPISGPLPFAGTLGLGSGLMRVERAEDGRATVTGSSVIRNLDRPGATVYEWSDGDPIVVMVVDESFDLED